MDTTQVAQIKQIYQNIGSLLEAGLFPGQFSQHLTEARLFVAKIVDDITKQEPKDEQASTEQQPQANDGDGT